MRIARGNPNPTPFQGTKVKDSNSIQTGAILFRVQAIPTLLAICEYIFPNPGTEEMVCVIGTLKEITYK